MTTTDHLVALPAEQDIERVERSAADLQAAARQAWLDNPALTASELGDRFDRSDRWARDRIAEARAVKAADGLPPGNNGNTLTATRQRNGTQGAAGNAALVAGGSHAPTSDAGSEPVAAPTALLAVTVAAVVIVALVTMFTSYSHTMDLAAMAGQTDFVARILPAAVDGLVIAGSTSLLVDHHLSRPVSPLAWAAVVLGLVSSMAANVVAVDPTLVDLRVVKWVMAAYAPLALAVSGHLLLRMLSQRH